MTAPASLLNLAASEFGRDVVNQIANGIGEEPSVTRAALGGAIPALIAGLVQKASTNQGATDLFELLRTRHLDGSRPIDPSRALAESGGLSHLADEGRPLLSSVFGPKASSIALWVSSQTGIRSGSASSLLSVAAPIVLGLVGRQVRGSGWSVSSLKSLLGSQRITMPGIPAGLSSVLDTDRDEERAEAESFRAPSYPTERQAGSSWWRWAVPLLVIGAGLLLFASRRQAPPTLALPTRMPTPTVPVRSQPDLGEMVAAVLPNGVSLSVPASGVENRVIAYLKDASAPIDSRKWFTFDRLQFETGSALPSPSSQEQLRNVAQIMKAYPNVAIRIGGYTDNVGDPQQNQALSEQRATNTMNAIIALGIAPSRVSARGYGDKSPVSDNSTEHGRQQNHRIDLNITKK